MYIGKFNEFNESSIIDTGIFHEKVVSTNFETLRQTMSKKQNDYTIKKFSETICGARVYCIFTENKLNYVVYRFWNGTIVYDQIKSELYIFGITVTNVYPNISYEFQKIRLYLEEPVEKRLIYFLLYLYIHYNEVKYNFKLAWKQVREFKQTTDFKFSFLDFNQNTNKDSDMFLRYMEVLGRVEENIFRFKKNRNKQISVKKFFNKQYNLYGNYTKR